jgi:hypothetical protein
MSDTKYGNRNVPKMYAQINKLRTTIRESGTPEIQTAFDAVEQHIDYVYRTHSHDVLALDRLIADAEERGMRKALDAASDYTQRVYGDDWKFLSNPIDRERILAPFTGKER